MAEEAAVGSELPAYSIAVNEAPKFDLKSYIAGYKGRTVFRRLYLIASCSTALREEAARLAIIEAKKGIDINNYNAAVTLLRSTSKAKDAEHLTDPSWAHEQEKKNAADAKRMENELKQYKNNLIRESIRMGNEDLGAHYYATGDLQQALKAFARMREFCTTPAHNASNAFHIIDVAIEQKQWLAVQSQVHKIRNLQWRSEDAARNQPKTATAMGLHHMSLGDFREAALSFLSTDPSLGDSYSEVITSNDVAVYGGLCALASMSRSELQSKVLENGNFRNFLELEPHIRRAIAYFCACKYSQCLDILDSYRVDYLLDIYLQSQVEHIYNQIRTKSIVQYFQPFSKVTLASMEQMFGNPTVAVADASADNGFTVSMGFLAELTSLIQSNLLDARIDLESMTLVANTPNIRTETQKQALDTVDSFVRETRVKLLRMGVLNAGLEVRPQLKSKPSAASGIAGGMDLAGMMADSNAGGVIGALEQNNFQGQGYSLRGAR